MSLAENISLKAFWDAVEQRLAACAADELRAILRAMAQGTPPAGRHAFLAQLEPVGEVIALQQEIEQDALLSDIDDLLSDLQATIEKGGGAWNERDDWNETDDEDSLGPYAEFVAPLVTLFDRAAAAFDTGNLPLARDAYEALSEAFNSEDDYGRGISAPDLIGVDMREASARHLRAIYETEPLANRPQTLSAQMRRANSSLYLPRPTLASLLQISPRPLPDQEQFLADWITFLRTQSDSDADAWLREAVRLAHGTPGLETLARAEGVSRPRAYLDWFAALAGEGKDRELLVAAQEALTLLPNGLPIRAAVADHLCAAAARLGETQIVRDGRWAAFLIKPTLPRLLDLWEAAPAGPEQSTEMRRALPHAQDRLAHPPANQDVAFAGGDDLERPVWVNPITLAHAALLAEDFGAAQRLADSLQVLGWSSSNPQGAVVPCLLALLTGKLPDALPPNLAKLWQEGLQQSYLATSTVFGTQGDPLPKRLERAYTQSFARVSLAYNQQATLLAWCLEVAQKRTHAIVGGQHRKSYDKAAILTVACAEVLQLRGDRAAASGLVNETRTRFPRHRAFLTELTTAVQAMERSLR